MEILDMWMDGKDKWPGRKKMEIRSCSTLIDTRKSPPLLGE
jgi:hypothetical protein